MIKRESKELSNCVIRFDSSFILLFAVLYSVSCGCKELCDLIRGKCFVRVTQIQAGEGICLGFGLGSGLGLGSRLGCRRRGLGEQSGDLVGRKRFVRVTGYFKLRSGLGFGSRLRLGFGLGSFFDNRSAVERRVGKEWGSGWSPSREKMV